MPEASTLQILIRAGMPLIVTWLLIPLTSALPLLDSTRAPYFDLSDRFSEFAYWVTESGGKAGTPIIALLLLAILVTRGGITARRRKTEAYVIALVAAIFAGGGAAINEYVVKAELKVPRPNIIWLAGENGNGPLGTTAKEFYEIGDKQARRKPLMEILSQEPKPIPLSPSIAAHWAHETGYSFPSGHSFSAFFFATFLLASAATYMTSTRLGLFYLLLPWALSVCYSRLILRVHTPIDITIGSLQGLLIGLLAWFIARAMIRGRCSN